MNNVIRKSFPANLSIEIEKDGKTVRTFLANKTNDGALYAYLLSKSIGLPGPRTVVKKKSLPPITKIIKELNIKSRTTFYTRLTSLKEAGFVEETKIGQDECYILHDDAQYIYYSISLLTLNYLLMFTKESYVFKTYIYLGKKFELESRTNDFTLVELGEHIGMSKSKSRAVLNCAEDYKKLWLALYSLQSVGLIDIEQIMVDNKPKCIIHNVEKDKAKAVPNMKRNWIKRLEDEENGNLDKSQLEEIQQRINNMLEEY